MTIVAFVITLSAAQVGALRWLRVAQREHYIAGSCITFMVRWWRSSALNLSLFGGGLTGIVVGAFVPEFALLTAAVVAIGPVGLSMKGRTSKLAWTRRLRTLAAVVAVVQAIILGVTGAFGAALPAVAAVALLMPVVFDLALLITAPFERRAAQRYVREARGRLDSVRPLVVAITGSYGKTSTKQHARHLIAGARSVVASPASFNNTAGLSRTINEQLSPGTEVFIAEMGMYGPGEIRSLCEWIRPKIGAITAIGPVHLERLGTIERIVQAKAEILEVVEIGVLNVDQPELAQLAAEFAHTDRRLIRCSTSTDADPDVAVVRDEATLDVIIDGTKVASITNTEAHSANLAVAVGIALAAGVDTAALARQLQTLPTPEHRQEVSTSKRGVTVIDNTFNANPASVRASLTKFDKLGGHARYRVVVTPGLVELGGRQSQENEAFAELASNVGTHVLIVGQTNRASLLRGADHKNTTVITMRTRDEAVAWVRQNLGEGDVVLYENDLPDHYP